jgi:ketosteroid isomerase-like protein
MLGFRKEGDGRWRGLRQPVVNVNPTIVESR